MSRAQMAALLEAQKHDVLVYENNADDHADSHRDRDGNNSTDVGAFFQGLAGSAEGVGRPALPQGEPARGLTGVPAPHHSNKPPANVSPAPTLQKIILSPSVKIPSSADQPRAIETLAALVLPYLPIVTTNLS